MTTGTWIVLVSEEGLPQLGEPVLAVALQRLAQENVVVGPLADEGLIVVKVLGGGAQPQVRVVVLPRSGQLPVRAREQRVGAAPLCRFNTTEPSAVVRPLAPISAASLMCCRCLIQLAILFYGARFFCRSAGPQLSEASVQDFA